ncbi:hypothetical protein LZG00_11510 [Rhodobacteraceae bacterium LMO-12]|nr:hypothetical protein [Rhodobacteraceae bacterium LMO-JJ12]
MSSIREEIRAILREEIAALGLGASGPRREAVAIRDSADLTRFAREIAERASDPSFAAALARGEVVFDLTGGSAANPVTTSPAAVPRATTTQAPQLQCVLSEKSLITERDVAALPTGQTSIRLCAKARLTPLAGDELRRRGIKVERNPT